MSRVQYLDFLRGFAMLLVVYGHALGGLGHGNSVAKELIYSFHMPLFFGISGFVAAWSMKNRVGEIGGIEWLVRYSWRKFCAIFVPYVIWCVVINPFVYGHADMYLGWHIDEIADLLRRVFVDPDALWFLPTLFVLSLSFGVYRFVCHKLGQESLLRWLQTPYHGAARRRTYAGEASSPPQLKRVLQLPLLIKVVLIIVLQVAFILLFVLGHNQFARTAMNYCLPYYVGVLAAEARTNFLVEEVVAKPLSWCGETPHLRRGGVLASPAEEGFATAPEDRRSKFLLALFVFVVSAALFVVFAKMHGDTYYLARCMRLVAGVSSIFVFFRVASKLPRKGVVYGILRYIGCNTLILYVLGEPIGGYGFMRTWASGWLNEYSVLLFAVVASLWIILPALAVGKLISYSPRLNRLLLGRK